MINSILVIPAISFTVTFSKICYLGIKIIVDKAKLKCSRVSIVQVSDIKKRLEELEVNVDKVILAPVDAINMYPSIKLSTIKLYRDSCKKTHPCNQ